MPPSPARERPIPRHCLTETRERVGVAETDMMGIVHHANYVVFFERGRLEYMRRRGRSYRELVGQGLHMPVIELNVRYRKPAAFDDVLQIETRLGALTRVTVRFDYRVSRAAPRPADAEPPALLLEGHVLLACIDERHRPRGLPADFVQALLAPEAPPTDTPAHSW